MRRKMIPNWAIANKRLDKSRTPNFQICSGSGVPNLFGHLPNKRDPRAYHIRKDSNRIAVPRDRRPDR